MLPVNPTFVSTAASSLATATVTTFAARATDSVGDDSAKSTNRINAQHEITSTISFVLFMALPRRCRCLGIYSPAAGRWKTRHGLCGGPQRRLHNER